MNLEERKDLLIRLGAFLKTGNDELQSAKRKAYNENQWFIPEFIDLAIKNITDNFLQPHQLQTLIDEYNIPPLNESPKKVGIVMAGNIPLVGFHDLLCVFITGNIAIVKPSSKDKQLMELVITKMAEWHPGVSEYLLIQDMLKGCDAYIATGSNNTSRYFEQYFGKYPHIIRKNRTSIALLKGTESAEQLEQLADDVHLFFGLGCRNVTKIYVPEGYDFVPLLTVFKKYSYLIDHNKYKNNYDYNLAIHILNKKLYMSNESLLLVEDESNFSPIAQLNYQFYKNADEVMDRLKNDDQIQCIVGYDETEFGAAQTPGICTFADGVNTVEFLLNLNTQEVRRP